MSTPPRVAVDYLPAVTHAPGVGRGVRELVRALVRLELADPLHLLLLELGRGRPAVPEAALGLESAGPESAGLDSSGPRIGPASVRRLRRACSRRGLRLRHALTGWGVDAWGGGADLVHQVLARPLPVRAARQVVAVSELPADEATRRRLAAMDAALVYSRHAAEEVAGRLQLPVHVVPVGSDHWSRELSGPVERRGPPRVLVLGGLRPERHHVTVLAACEALAAGGLGVALDVVGGGGQAAPAFAAAVRASPLRDRVVRHAPDEAAMPGLVARASVLVHLNVSELTPVTPLEAFACGTPVVASRLAPFEEALDGRARLVDTAEVVARPVRLADAMAQAVDQAADAAACEVLRAVAARFTWEASARATAGVWRAVLEARPA